MELKNMFYSRLLYNNLYFICIVIWNGNKGQFDIVLYKFQTVFLQKKIYRITAVQGLSGNNFDLLNINRKINI